MQGRRPKVTIEQYKRILSVAAARRSVPSNLELARELGISLARVVQIMRHRIKRYDVELEPRRGRIDAR